MNEIYGIQLLLQSKNPLLFNKTDKIRLGNLLQESSHFKLAITSQESKRNIVRLYKYIIMKKYNKNQFIYHKVDPDNHLYVILKGKVACFVPNSQANLLGVSSWSNDGAKSNQDGNNSYKYMNKDDEDLLNNEINYSNVYFNGNNCLYRKIKILQAGESFGGYTQFHEATFIATEDITVVVIPYKKYEIFFQPEAYRYNFINGSLAEMFCKNEQNVRLLIQEEEKLSQIIQQGNNPSSSPISSTRKVNSHIIDSVFSQYTSNSTRVQSPRKNKINNNSNRNNAQMNKLELNFSSSAAAGIENSDVNQNGDISDKRNKSVSLEERKMNDSEQNPSNQSILNEEKKQSVELMLRCSELSFHFELFKFEESKYVYNENDVVDYYYLVSSGKMLLKKSGLQEPIKEYSEGDFFGFEDDNSKRIFSCYVEKDTMAYRILKREFEMNINNNIFSFFKQLQRYKKKQYIEKYKEIKESGLIRGIHRKVKSLNTRDIHYKIQLKKQIAQEILDVMQNSKFNTQKQINTPNQSSQPNSNSNFYEIQQNYSNESSSNTNKNNSSRLRSALSLHNLSDKSNKNHVRFNFEKESGTQGFPSPLQSAQSPPNQIQKFTQLSSPLKIQHAQRMVMDQIKKTAQMMEEEKKKTLFNNISRNVDVQFIKFQVIENKQQDADISPILNKNIFSSTTLHKSSSNLNRLNSVDSQCLSPFTKYRKQSEKTTPLNFQCISPSPAKRGSELSLSQQLHIPLKSVTNTFLFDQSTEKNNFQNYKKLNTFSNIYHNKRTILSITPLNFCQKSKKDRKQEHEEPEIVKSNQAPLKNTQEEHLTNEIDEMQQKNLENPEWLLETAKRLKDIDLGKIKNDIERQILSIPKQYQDKLWGQSAYKNVSHKFQQQK